MAKTTESPKKTATKKGDTAKVKKEIKKENQKKGFQTKGLKLASIKSATRFAGVDYQRQSAVAAIHRYLENSIKQLARRAKTNADASGHKTISVKDLQKEFII